MCFGTTRVEAFVYPRPAAWRSVWPPSVVETRAKRRERFGIRLTMKA